jgi:hypothetical protein
VGAAQHAVLFSPPPAQPGLPHRCPAAHLLTQVTFSSCTAVVVAEVPGSNAADHHTSFPSWVATWDKTHRLFFEGMKRKNNMKKGFLRLTKNLLLFLMVFL